MLVFGGSKSRKLPLPSLPTANPLLIRETEESSRTFCIFSRSVHSFTYGRSRPWCLCYATRKMPKCKVWRGRYLTRSPISCRSTWRRGAKRGVIGGGVERYGQPLKQFILKRVRMMIQFFQKRDLRRVLVHVKHMSKWELSGRTFTSSAKLAPIRFGKPGAIPYTRTAPLGGSCFFLNKWHPPKVVINFSPWVPRIILQQFFSTESPLGFESGVLKPEQWQMLNLPLLWFCLVNREIPCIDMLFYHINTIRGWSTYSPPTYPPQN